MDIKKCPVVIVGSGIAGLLTALKLSKNGIASVVVTKTSLNENSSGLAQGGIAAVLPENTSDSIELHVKDTLFAGAGLSDEAMTRSILSEGHLAIEDLIELGVPFDKVDGKLAFTKEAAHTTQRILHAGGDATGRSIQDTLIYKVKNDPLIQVFESCSAVRLLVKDNRCHGVYAVDHHDDLNPMVLLSGNTVLATGGIGRLYTQTTNPAIATGDGVALAYLAGAKIQDMEFVQFHPTAFWADGKVQFLVSEALRGEGAILRDKSGRAFARDYHPDGELAPRDIVTRAISAQLIKDQTPHVHLDITHLPAETIELRFPNILKAAERFGVDIRKDMIPVAPAAHYGMGGVQVDDHGQTSIEHLFAVGEVVSSGLHGANRLASNSLLECVVLARRVAAQVVETPESMPEGLLESLPKLVPHPEAMAQLSQAVPVLRDVMWQHVGILRDADGLKTALKVMSHLEAIAEEHTLFEQAPHGIEYRDMLIASRLIAEAALSREESRGAHCRTDFPETDVAPCHTLQQFSPRKTEVCV